jgi:hypothetical protein
MIVTPPTAKVVITLTFDIARKNLDVKSEGAPMKFVEGAALCAQAVLIFLNLEAQQQSMLVGQDGRKMNAPPNTEPH